MNRVTVETQNVRAAKNAVRDCVNNNGFMAVIAEVGAGKTRLFNILTEHWEKYPHKFSVVKLRSFRQRAGNSRISSIMNELIRAIDPDTDIPRVIEQRYALLEDCLRSSKKNIILIIDEAQDMSVQTFRDLKKIHEIDGDRENLFSIILLGKTHRQWNHILKTPELGYRINCLKLEDLTSDEIIQIAEESFNLKFENQRVRDRFCSAVKYKTPLGVKFISNALRMQTGAGKTESFTVTSEIIKIVPYLTIKYRVRQANIKNVDIVETAQKALPHRKINKQRISELLNGHLDNDVLEGELTAVIESMISNQFAESRVNHG